MRQTMQQMKPRSTATPEVCEQPEAMELWRGASGRRYVHAVTSLLMCRPMPKATYILARRAEDRLTVLEIGRLENEADTLNLATIRQRGAMLGANEVHLHTLADSEAERACIAFDIEAALELRFPEKPSRIAQ